jgi:hypothetical protein
VVLGGDRPTVTLDRGAHELSGRFVWQATPRACPSRSRSGSSPCAAGPGGPQPRRDKADSVWLGRSETAAPEEPEGWRWRSSALNDGVFSDRDAVRARVSGRAREVSLGTRCCRQPAAGAILRAPGAPRRSGLALRTGPCRRARRRAFGADANTPVRIARPAVAAPWRTRRSGLGPAPNLRQVQVSAGRRRPGTDLLPESWRNLLPTSPPARPARAEHRAARSGAAPANVVNLSREVWLDADGRAFTVRVTLGGT